MRRAVTPDFGSLAAIQYRLEGAFRAVHTRLRTHAESVAFFGGGAAEVRLFCCVPIALCQQCIPDYHHSGYCNDRYLNLHLLWKHSLSTSVFTAMLPERRARRLRQPSTG